MRVIVNLNQVVDRNFQCCCEGSCKRNQDVCLGTSFLKPRVGIIGRYVEIKADHYGKYTRTNYSITWYKNCKVYEEKTKSLQFGSVQSSDAGIYTFVLTLTHNGQHFNVSESTNLTVRDETEPVKPQIKGIGNITVYMEIGTNQTLECEAFVGFSKNNDWAEMYWLQENNTVSGDGTNNEDIFVDDCTEIIQSTCFKINRKFKEDHVTISTKLHIINAKEEDIKNPYKCVLKNLYSTDIKYFILMKKEQSGDISKTMFNRYIATILSCSVCIVMLVIVCILLKIEIILLFRRLMGKDETIGDSKEYDAYLPFLNHSLAEDDNQRQFALITLPTVLEENFGYKLCVFERDILPGGALADEINSYIDKSRRLIIVLGKNQTSDNALYELEAGLHKAMVERKIKIIVIEYTPQRELNVLLESLQLLNTNNRVIWRGSKSHPLNSRFWKKIQYLMPAKPSKPKTSLKTMLLLDSSN
ncbi:hypothetical protein GDO86_003877 [Hymenochirus boettgeri]|uniref:Interleukin-18 receptor 1 n=1 Tax=Hymenochirus boettgeri TaxID=247094 RepID=A0A8T2K3H2_9PIPI|nr:hypothetical protein GDO86_003877 [Hymenochirus boettgeri]